MNKNIKVWPWRIRQNWKSQATITSTPHYTSNHCPHLPETASFILEVLWWIILCVNLTELSNDQMSGEMLFLDKPKELLLREKFWIGSLKSPSPNVGRRYLIFWGLEWNKKAPFLCRTNLQAGPSGSRCQANSCKPRLLCCLTPGWPPWTWSPGTAQWSPVLCQPRQTWGPVCWVHHCSCQDHLSDLRLQVHPRGPKYHACQLLMCHQNCLPENSSRKPAQWQHQTVHLETGTRLSLLKSVCKD